MSNGTSSTATVAVGEGQPVKVKINIPKASQGTESPILTSDEIAAREASTQYRDLTELAGGKRRSSSKTEAAKSEAKEPEQSQQQARSLGEAIALEFENDISEPNPTAPNLTVVVEADAKSIRISLADAKMILPGQNGEAPTPEEFARKFREALPLMDGVQLVRSLRFAEKLVRSARQLEITGVDESLIAELYATADAVDAATRVELELRVPSVANMSFKDREIADAKSLTDRITVVVENNTEQTSTVQSNERQDNREVSISSAQVSFDEQIFIEFAHFMTGENVHVQRSPGSVITVTRVNGETVVTLPTEFTVRDFGVFAQRLREQYPQSATEDRGIAFGEQLTDAAYMMASMNLSEGREVFSGDAIEMVYNSGRALVSPEDRLMPKTAAQIQERLDTHEVASRLTADRQQEVALKILLGQDTTYTVDGQVQQTFYDRFYQRWQAHNPNGTQEQFHRYLEEHNYLAKTLARFVNKDVAEGRVIQTKMTEVAKQRVTESVDQALVDNWINAIRNISGTHNASFTQSIHQALLNEEIDVRGRLTDRQRIEVVTRLMQSPTIVEQLQYMPSELVEALRTQSERPEALRTPSEQLLYEQACVYKDIYTKAALESLGFQVGVMRAGVHRYLLVEVNGQMLQVDPNIPLQITENGITTQLSGVTEVTNAQELQQARISMTEDGDAILLSATYHNAAMLCEDEDLQTRFLNRAHVADPKSPETLWALGRHDEARALNPNIEEDMARTGEKIGAWAPRDAGGILINFATPGFATLRGIRDQINARLVALFPTNPGAQPSELNFQLLDSYAQILRNTVATTRNQPVADAALAMHAEIAQALAVAAAREGNNRGLNTEQIKLKNDIQKYEDDLAIYLAGPPPGTLAGLPTVLQDERSRLSIAINLEIDKEPSFDQTRYPDFILEWASKFDEPRLRVINSIMWNPYNVVSETNQYEISFYANPIMKEMITSLKTMATTYRNAGDVDAANYYQAQYDWYYSLQDSAKTCHGMNKLINEGEIGALTKVAGEMNKEHFAVMTKINGAGHVQRIYEEEYNKMLARENRITAAGYQEIKANVKARIKLLNRLGVIRSEFELQRKIPEVRNATNPALIDQGPSLLETWEFDRMFNAGRAMYNMNERAAMHISLGATESGISYGLSKPQGRIAETFNLWRTVIERWGMGGKEGQEFAKEVGESWAIAMKEYRYVQGINKIHRAGGVEIDAMQNAAQLCFVDFLTKFRLQNVAFPRIYMETPNGNPNNISVFDYFDKMPYPGPGPGTGMPMLEFIKDVQNPANDAKYGGQAARRTLLNNQLRIIVDTTGLGLNSLLMHASFFNAEFDPRETYEARVYAWQKIAQVNLPATVDRLTGLQFSRKDANGVSMRDANGNPILDRGYGRDRHGVVGQIQSLEDILGGTRYYVGGQLTDAWNGSEAMRAAGQLGLREKLEFNRMVYEQREMLKNPESKVSKAVALNPNYIPPEIVLNAQETVIAMDIQTNGERLADHLADIYANSEAWDIPLEELEYERLASDEYRRNVSGDAAQLFNAFMGLGNVLNNPGAQGPREMEENLTPVFDNMRDVASLLTAQQNLYPIIEVISKWNRTSRSMRSEWIGGPARDLKIATSKAQKVSGPLAESQNEQQALDVIMMLRRKRFLNDSLYRKLKEETDTTWLFSILRVLFHDLLPVLPVLAAKEIGVPAFSNVAA